MRRRILVGLFVLTACGQASVANRGTATPLPRPLLPMITPTPFASAEPAPQAALPTPSAPVPSAADASSVLATLDIPLPPASVSYQPGSLGSDQQILADYIASIRAVFTEGMPIQQQTLVAQEVYVSTQSLAELRGFYEERLMAAGWELVQASDEPGRIRDLLLYQRVIGKTGYGLYLNLTQNPNDQQDPHTYVFITVGQAQG